MGKKSPGKDSSSLLGTHDIVWNMHDMEGPAPCNGSDINSVAVLVPSMTVAASGILIYAESVRNEKTGGRCFQNAVPGPRQTTIPIKATPKAPE
jgi:hypothetical protein